jgi:hypothetical protein
MAGLCLVPGDSSSLVRLVLQDSSSLVLQDSSSLALEDSSLLTLPASDPTMVSRPR